MTTPSIVKRLLVGRALRSQQLQETLLPKWLALPVFASDPISSVAYATEEIVLVLASGGAAYLAFSKWVAAIIAALLVIVIASYRQTCRAYPNGGGAFAVSLDNFGENAALVAAAALLVDYVMTVAVSVVAGVIGITSAAPSLQPHAVALSVGFVVLLMLANLRGLKEAGRLFAIPTYAFVSLTYLMFVVGAAKGLTGHLNDAATASQQIHRTAHVGGALTLVLLLRAFASGCTALTGVEAISNGVPAFRPPKARNAANTLAIMGALSVSMFVGITILALHLKARAQSSGNPSVISQIAATVFGGHTALFYLYQAATAGILILAANTAFNGFPLLSSILAQNGYLPRQMHNRGDKLVFSNGILLLGASAIALIIGYHANVDSLIHLYIIGVFTSFTLSQAGMVRHWNRTIAASPRAQRHRMHVARVINLVGAAATTLVLLIVIYTKVTQGAWIAILAMIFIFVLMKLISRHYAAIAAELTITESEKPALPPRNHALVLVSRLHLPTMRAISYAKATRPSSLTAVTVQIDQAETARLAEEWDRHVPDIPLVTLDSPYRETTRPVLKYLRGLHRESPRDVITVFLPEYVVGHWWEQLLHNQSALRLKARLLFEDGVMVTSVPWQLRSSSRLHPVDPHATRRRSPIRLRRPGRR
ncbi:APC family permease [Pseudofrankia sp. DC12]|uniref:APC family permease n=1 Tax=Pseudofrankia sp. DC12 TaxID=683315 RepID=UPI0005F86135|nr:APC family permease [Pseudofrankia sp. DC12]